MQDVSSGSTGRTPQGQGRRSVPSASASHGKERENEMNDDLVKQLLAAVLDLNKTVGNLKQTVGGLAASVEALNKRFDQQNESFKQVAGSFTMAVEAQNRRIEQQNENFKQQSSDIRQTRNWIVGGLGALIAILLTAGLAHYCGVSDKIETIRQLFPPQ